MPPEFQSSFFILGKVSQLAKKHSRGRCAWHNHWLLKLKSFTRGDTFYENIFASKIPPKGATSMWNLQQRPRYTSMLFEKLCREGNLDHQIFNKLLKKCTMDN
ncbi:MAG: hypothetical protein ABIU77_25640, partial [Ferruginibacter sp.]